MAVCAGDFHQGIFLFTTALCSSLHPLDVCCISTLPIHIRTIDSRSSLRSATLTMAVCAGDCHHGIFLFITAAMFLFTSARYVLYFNSPYLHLRYWFALELVLSDPTQRQSALETVTEVFSYLHLLSFPLHICSICAAFQGLCCISRICAVFQIFLFTSALLIHARFCAQRPRQWQSSLEMVTKVFRADCNQGNRAVVNRKIPWLQSPLYSLQCRLPLSRSLWYFCT